ncbi:MAG: cytochrome c [Epsilonproteobacteria bacterium]|nr:cytochrome c [Campylobacterota bacterium]
MKYLTLFTLLFFATLLSGKATFITQMEYASSLYKNPRGIGCDKCHGINGEGKVIANYVHKGVKKSFVCPAIRDLGFQDFYNALKQRKKGMPRYFLTTEEIKALYLYLHRDDKKKAQ